MNGVLKCIEQSTCQAIFFSLKQSIFVHRRGTGNPCIRLINICHAINSRPNCTRIFEQYGLLALL